MKKINWAERFDHFPDEKLAYLLTNEAKLKTLSRETDTKIINAIKNQRIPESVINIFGRLSDYLFFRKNMVKFSLAAAIFIVLVISAIIFQNIMAGKEKIEQFLVTGLEGNAHYFDQSGNKKELTLNAGITGDGTVITEDMSALTMLKNKAIKIDLKANSRIRIRDEKENIILLLDNGKVSFDVNEFLLKKNLLIRTALCNVRVTGTRFSMTAALSNFFALTVYEGSVKVIVNYNLSKDINLLASKNQRYAEQIHDVLEEEFMLASGQNIAIDKKIFTENENSIKGLLNQLIADSGKEPINADKKNEIVLKIKQMKFKNIRTNKAVTINGGETQISTKENSKKELIPIAGNKIAEIIEKVTGAIKGKIRSERIKIDGCIGEWLFSGIADDTSGYTNHGQIGGTQLTKDRFGNENSACYFNGRSFVKINNNAALKDIEKTDVFSISVWFNIEAWLGGYFAIIDKYSHLGNFGYVLDATYLYGIGFLIADNIKFGYQMIPELGLWHHLVFINYRENNKQYFYLTGEKITEANNYFNINADSDLYIGYSPSGLIEYAKGTIDDLRIFKKALTADEVKELYSEGGFSN